MMRAPRPSSLMSPPRRGAVAGAALCAALAPLSACKPRDAESSRALADASAPTADKAAPTAFEIPPADEPQDIAKIVGGMQAAVKQKAEKQASVLRFTHAKTLGCVAARFTVPDDLDQDLRVGLFAKPHQYNAWVRYSSFAFTPQSDAVPDNRGMSVKVLDVAGEKLQPGGERDPNVDLVLTNDVSFFFPTAKKFLNFLQIGPQEWFKQNPREAGVHKRAVKAGVYGSLFEGTFGSMTPYLFGQDRAVKFVAKPCSVKPTAPGTGAEFLSERLRADLDAGKDACYDLYVQFFVNQDATPIEDPSVDWREEVTKPRKVATITVPPQPKSLIDGMQASCEDMSFSPWRTVAEHRPLGGINRVRRQVYWALNQQRHAINHAKDHKPNVEPRAADFPRLDAKGDAPR